MIRSKVKNQCKKIRHKLSAAVIGKLIARGGWVDSHIAKCPRCRARLQRIGDVEFALSIIKSQPQRLDLLAKANTQAVNVLKHSLREAPKAEQLKQGHDYKEWYEKSGVYLVPLSKTAACLMIVLFMKMGIISSMNNFCKEGDSAVRHHYARYLGEEYADEIYSA
jgi:hypothetical protein